MLKKLNGKKIDESILQVLSRVTVDGNMIFLTCGQLDRKAYLAVNEVLENIGGKWNRKEKAHVYTEDPTERLESVLLTGEIIPPKKFGYFPTPDKIARQIIELAEIEPHHMVLEPSAGDGAIIKFIPECETLDCVEILPENIKKLQSLGMSPFECDFLILVEKPVYDRIVANPPFSYEGHPQADIDHVNHMVGCLAPEGRIVSIMGAGVMFRENKKTITFRKMVEEHNGYFEKLPEKSFSESGTNVNACIVVINN